MANTSENNAELLQELEALSQTLYQSHTAHRTASLALPRSVNPGPANAPSAPIGCSEHHGAFEGARSEGRPRTSRMSMSPWRSRPSSKQQQPDDRGGDDDDDGRRSQRRPPSTTGTTTGKTDAVLEEKKGIWNWKPMRALSHITMQRMGCLFSVDVVAIQGLPASMNGLRLSVSVRKKETRDGTVQTMPARVLHGAADFEETMFIRCNVYCSGGSGTGKLIKFEPRPFYVSAVAIDAPELDFGKSSVDLSLLMKESMEKNMEGARVRQWDRSFRLTGKAKGGELVVKLGFQIMEDGGAGIYANPDGRQTPTLRKGNQSPSIARKQSKSSFSITSPRMPGKLELPPTPSKSDADFNEIDDFKLDDPAPASVPVPVPVPVPMAPVEVIKVEDLDLPEFDVVDKGIEVENEEKPEKEEEQKRHEEEEEEEEEAKSASSEVVVKEVVVQDPAHQLRMSEIESIAKQLTSLESMLTTDDSSEASKNNPDSLDANEETVKREFLQLLELEGDRHFRFDTQNLSSTPKSTGNADDFDKSDTKSFLPDLGKGLGSVVRTKDGGYLAAANPFDVEVRRRETPKLAIQISKPLVLKDQKSSTGFELFQRMAAMGPEALGPELLSMTAMDELMGKTAEQIAFEGIAEGIISGRSREGASSSAARLVATLKDMSTSASAGRKERILTGLWNAGEEPVNAEGLLSFSLQRIESMAVEALKIQADVAEEDAPFNVFPLMGKDNPNPPLSSALALDEWMKTKRSTVGDVTVVVVVVVQTRDPVRRYEKVGAPVVAMVQAVGVGRKEGEERYKVGSVHMGGMRVRAGGRGGGWDGKKERSTAAQWLGACGMGKKGKSNQAGTGAGGNDLLWSLSSRIVADMWLKPLRNPDVKFPM